MVIPLVLLTAGPAQAAEIGAAGDIACDPDGEFFLGGLGDATHCRQMSTADMLASDTSLNAILPLGDVQYEDGALDEFQRSFEPSWGRAALENKLRPAIGNHEYFAGSGDPRGSGYFDYFNGVGNQTGVAGDRTKGYYSYDVGAWHLIALNSVCQEVGGCQAGSPQEQWLRADLETHQNACTLAYWHHPLWASGSGGYMPATKDLWQTLYEGGAEVVLAGHAHFYERYAPQDAKGTVDTTYGLRQFIVGTGGKNLNSFGTIQPNSVARDNQHFGFLKMTLNATSYQWAFKRENGTTGDSGTASCHGAPPGGTPEAKTGEATSVTDTTARLNGAVNPQSRAAKYRFEYGPTTGYSLQTAWQDVTPVNSAHRQVGAEVSGLVPGTTYHYRVVAQSDAGTITGEDRTFTAGSGLAGYGAVIAGTPGLRSYWRLGEGSGGFGWDQKGLDLGTYRGGASLGQPGAIAGDSNGSAGFDGVDDELSATGPTVSTTGTMEGWFLWRAGKTIFRDDSWGGGWALAYENTSGNLGYRIGGSVFSTGKPVSIARDGRWHHLALTKNGPDVKLYLDGAVLHDPAGDAANSAASGPWHVMKNGQHTDFAQGQADEVAVYEVALSAEAVKEHYLAGTPDSTPPDTSITAGPSGGTRETSASFSFTSTESRSSFRCRLDGPGGVGTEEACTSPKSYSGLADGTYTFRVHAVDLAGNADQSPATRTFTVDATPPETTIDSGPAGATTSTDAQFSFSSSEAGSSFQCRLDGGTWSACTSPKSYSGLAVGPHTFEVFATDQAGNADASPASRSWTVESAPPAPDTTAPDTTITGGPSGTTSNTSASFSFESSESGSSFQCRLDGKAWAGCTSPKSYTKLSSGTHKFEVRAIDTAANMDTSPATRSWTIKRGAASSTTFFGPAERTRSYRPTRYDIRSGNVFGDRGALRRLYRDDGRRLDIAAVRKRRGVYITDFASRMRVGATELATLDAIEVTYNGSVSVRRAAVSLRIYNVRARRWVTLDGPARTGRADRAVVSAVRRDPLDYVASSGQVRVRVAAKTRQPLRNRADLLRLTVAY